MIYTEKDLEQAYAIGYNEAVDDVNEYIDQESMEFSLDESYYDDYSAVEDAIMNETSSTNKDKHQAAIYREVDKREADPWYRTKYGGARSTALTKAFQKRNFDNDGKGRLHPKVDDRAASSKKMMERYAANRHKIFGN